VPEILGQVEGFLEAMDDDRSEVLLSSAPLYSEEFDNALGLFTDIWVRMAVEKRTLTLANILHQVYKIENTFEPDPKKVIFETIVKIIARAEVLQQVGKNFVVGIPSVVNGMYVACI
jgi:hypothetical protein